MIFCYFIVVAKKGSHLLVKFLLHLCNNDGKNMDSGEALDFYQNYSNCCPLQYDFQNVGIYERSPSSFYLCLIISTMQLVLTNIATAVTLQGNS